MEEIATLLAFSHEILLLLDQAGFGEVTVYGADTDAVATAEDTWRVFVARKDAQARRWCVPCTLAFAALRA